MEGSVTILSTKILPAGLWQPLQWQGIEVVQHNFIEVVPHPLERWAHMLKDYLAQGKHEKHIIITGKNGVAALNRFIEREGKADLVYADFYCVGSHTAQQLLRMGYSVKAQAHNAEALCQTLLPVGVPYLYIGGNLSTGVIEDFFIQKQYRLQKLEVYITVHKPVQIEQELAGILFGSPSAVLSFFAKNKWPPGAVAFSIGATTAAALHGCSVQAVQQPVEPGWPALVQCCADYFSRGKK